MPDMPISSTICTAERLGVLTLINEKYAAGGVTGMKSPNLTGAHAASSDGGEFISMYFNGYVDILQIIASSAVLFRDRY